MVKQNKKAQKALTRTDVRNMIQAMAEVKRFVSLTTASVPAAAGTVINLSNGIIQGDDLTQRSGDKIRVVSTVLRVRFSAVVANQTVRFILFKDNINRAATPAVTEVLNSASLMSQFNTTASLSNRFSVLADVSLSCSLNGEAIKEKVVTVKRKYPIFYNGATAIASANGAGSTFVLVIGETASGLYDVAYEAHYTDM